MPSLTVSVTEADHIQGGNRAKVTLVEYGDFECGYCGLAAPAVRRVQAHFGSQLRFVFRHFPLSEMHPLAEGAAEAAEFAGAHGAFWAMHDQLYQNQGELGLPLYAAVAASLGLPEPGLRVAIASHAYSAKIESDFDGGVRSGVNGTPAFYVNGQRHDSSYEYDGLRAAIEAQLVMA